MTSRSALLAPFLSVALLAACAAPNAGTDQSPPPDPTPAIDVTPMPPADDNGQVTGEVPDQLMRQILADAEDRTGVEEDEIELVTAEAVTWNDGALGCPEPGMMYTQALVDGYRIVLDAGGEELNYHTDDRGHFVYCEDPQSEGMPRG